MPKRSVGATLSQILVEFGRDHTLSQAELAKRCGVEVRAVKRNLVELQAAGVPLVRDEDPPHVYWSVPRSWRGGMVSLATDDVLLVARLIGRLPASTTKRAAMKILAEGLRKKPVDDVSDALEVLVGPEQPWEIRSIATRELVKRGRRKVVDVLLEEVGSATGTRLNGLLSQLTASGDPRAVPVLLERFEKAPPGEGRPFLMSLAQNSSADAAKALLQLYRGPVRLVGKAASGPLTTRNYLPTLLLNLRGSEDLVLAAYQELPKAEWQLRAPLLQVLVGIAADRENKELAERFVAPVRAVLFDRDELPQLRVLALNLLSFRWILIEDALKLKNLRQQESPQMRALFTDFLLDAF